MARQNRVTPTGEIVALPYRGTLMSNRGVLHENGVVRHPWVSRAWIACVTERPGIRRELMKPDRYTELFFLDEVHALAAGHRPCAECRRPAFNAYMERTPHTRVDPLDRALESQRLTGASGQRRASRLKRTHPRAPGNVPVGAMVLVGRTAFARTAQGFVGWHEDAPEAYLAAFSGQARRDRDTLWASLQSEAPLAMLTPPTSAAVLEAGYEPEWHPSATDAEIV